MLTNKRRAESPQHAGTVRKKSSGYPAYVPPELKPGTNIPIWHHSKSGKIDVVKMHENTLGGQVQLTSDTVAVRIFPEPDSADWRIEFTIIHATPLPPTKNSVRFTTTELAQAFGYARGASVRNKFIRHEKYLNIPGPGTGQDGDSNLSILVSGRISDAVYILVEG